MIGQALEQYRILGKIGSGGMGEVYRAWDTRLHREVAIKVLPSLLSCDADRLRRFELEAKAAAAANHPNILAVLQMGTCEGAPYLVSELLDGCTLREHLRRGPLPLRKSLDFAKQVASGLAAAHEKGIVHRDLKPENIFVTKDGRIKILDFGLAKLTQPESSSTATARTIDQQTEPGRMMGTIGYMSPEQVRGEHVDHRTDFFAFGAILYELLSGQRAFSGPSPSETIGLILKGDPPALSQLTPATPQPLERIVRRCVEKNPEQRFQSASDLAFSLESLSTASDAYPALLDKNPPETWPRRGLLFAVVVLGVTSLAGIALFGARHFARVTPIRFEDVILRPGQFGGARFAPDGRTVVYEAGFRFGERGLFVADANTRVGRSIGMPDAALLAVSSKAELALLLSPHPAFEHASNAIVGTLARAPLSGGTPRAVLENVQSADWSSDGTQLGISRYISERNTCVLEYPVGHVLYETKGYVSDVRISPDGKFLAFMNHPVLGDNVGSVDFVDQFGKRKTISPESWPKSWGEEGLAWAPSGKEVWFTNQTGLWASDLSGHTRSLIQMAGLYLRDIDRDGSVLLYQFAGSASMTLHAWTKSTIRRDLSWLDGPIVTDISQDGTAIIFSEQGVGGGPEYMMYVRKTDGSPAVQLSPGRSGTISPDGQSAIIVGFAIPLQLSLVPLHMGETRLLTNDSITHYEAQWMPDSAHFVFGGQEPDHGVRTYLQSVHDNSPKAITPEGCAPRAVSLDGKLMLAECIGQARWKIYSMEGEKPFLPKGLEAGEAPLAWSDDRRLWVLNSWYLNSARIFKVNPYTGSREPWKEIPLDSFSGIHTAVITADGNTFVHSDWASFGSLRRVYGLR